MSDNNDKCCKCDCNCGEKKDEFLDKLGKLK